jgi:hypothetical protein
MLRALHSLIGRGVVRRQRGRRPWRLERLEDRSVPAGNVLATLAGSTLTLIGDDQGNSVQILPGSVLNEVVVSGVDTTVNGSMSPQVFSGVENLVAHLLDGDDSLLVQGVTISAPSFSTVFVDGNAGDDRIEFVDANIHAVDSIDMQIYGERVIGGFASGTSGNDTISLIGTSLTTQAFVSVQIYGETNQGGVISGGNDTITVADSEIVASGGFFHAVQVQIVGDLNSSLGGQTSSIGSGNDRISISNTTIAAASDLFSFGNLVSVSIIGDMNMANAFDPNTFSGSDSAATIGGGNDSIAVTNTDISVSGVNFGTSQTGVIIAGEQSFVAGFLPENTTAATIGGGNDSITVADSSVAANGNDLGNGAFMEIRGEDIQVQGPPGASTTSTIGGGNDTIVVSNVPITAVSPSGDAAALVVRSEYVVAFGSGLSVVGGGNDVIKVLDVQMPGNAIDDFRAIIVESGTGNDRVEISNSAARFFTVHLGDGNDRLTFNTNVVGEEASLDGGLGFDRIVGHGNTGTLVIFDFEDTDVTP